MQKVLTTLWLAAVMAISTQFSAAQEVDQQDPAYAAVKAAVANGDSAESVVQMITEPPHNKTLAEATIYAMVAGGEDNRTAMIQAGVGLADNLPEAQQVVYAVEVVAGRTSADAATARSALEAFVNALPAPPVYKQEYSPTGGGTDVSRS